MIVDPLGRRIRRTAGFIRHIIAESDHGGDVDVIAGTWMIRDVEPLEEMHESQKQATSALQRGTGGKEVT